jgi:hypothetical protein
VALVALGAIIPYEMVNMSAQTSATASIQANFNVNASAVAKGLTRLLAVATILGAGAGGDGREATFAPRGQGRRSKA